MLEKVKQFPWVVAWALVACSGPPEAGPTAPVSEPRPPKVVVTRLAVEEATPPEYRVAAPATDLTALVRTRLEGAGFTFADSAPDDAVRLTLEARLARGLTAGEGFLLPTAERPVGTRTRAVWVVEGKLKVPGGTGGEYLFLEGADEAPLEPTGEPTAALARHAEKALDPVVQGLLVRTALVGQSAQALVGKLADADWAVRLAAVERLAVLRDASTMEALVNLAKTEQNREVLLRLIGVFGELGDDRAAQALIGLANPRDREMLRAVLDALSVVGGERVTDFFDILASHDAPDVREMVEEARARLARKAEAPPSREAP